MPNPLDDLTGKNVIVDGVPMPDRKVLELVAGDGITFEASDDAVNGRTVIEITAGAVGSTNPIAGPIGEEMLVRGYDTADSGEAATSLVIRGGNHTDSGTVGHTIVRAPVSYAVGTDGTVRLEKASSDAVVIVSNLGAFVALTTYADDAAAGVGGLTAGYLYKTAGGVVMVKL